MHNYLYQQMSLTLHDEIISAYISVSVYQQMCPALHDDIILVYIYLYGSINKCPYQCNEDIISVYISVSTNVPYIT